MLWLSIIDIQTGNKANEEKVFLEKKMLLYKVLSCMMWISYNV